MVFDEMKNIFRSKVALGWVFFWMILVQASMYAIYIPLEGRMVDRYHGADARRDFAIVNKRIDQLSKDCNKLKEVKKDLKEIENGN